MLFICDAPNGRTWFEIENEIEASRESGLMNHAVEKYFLRAMEEAGKSFVPASRAFIEQDIGRAAHIRRIMPVFATLRDAEGGGLATAMLPPRGEKDGAFAPVVVGHSNADPYPEHADAIEALAIFFGVALERGRCYPYRR
jgi:hypothetical protein